MFKKVDSKKKSQHVIEQIVQAIQEGVYKIGHKLPSEREIARQMGVSRASVREALSILTVAGVLTRRVGDGTYVQTSDERALLNALSLFSNEPDLFEIFELQKVLEPAVAELALEKVEEEDLVRIEAALEQMRMGIEEGNREQYIQGDRAFHLAIARATRNTLIQRHVSELIELMNRALWKQFKRYSVDLFKDIDYFLQSLKTHQEILQALKERNRQQLRKTMETHFERVAKKVFGYYGNRRSDEFEGKA